MRFLSVGPGSVRVVKIPYSPLAQRHARWLARFSVCLDLHEEHYQIVLDAVAATQLTCFLVGALDIPIPIVKPHRGRKLNTGRCEPSRLDLIAAFGDARVEADERRRGRRHPDRPVVRFGNPTLAGVVGHEVAHCSVHAVDGVRTPGHGKVWVSRYDEVARLVAGWPGLPDLGWALPSRSGRAGVRR